MAMMKTIERGNIPAEIMEHPIYLYGAGATGKVCYPALVEAGVQVAAVVDDFAAKWGKYMDTSRQNTGGGVIIPFSELKEICERQERTNVVLTNIYAKPILKRLSKLHGVAVYEMYGWYKYLLDKKNVGEVVEVYCKDENKLEQLKQRTDALRSKLADDESGAVFDALIQWFKTEDYKVFEDVASDETHYFVHEVAEHFKGKEIDIVDGGAYEGEFLHLIEEAGVKVRNWYCFELDPNNYKRMEKYMATTKLPEGMKYTGVPMGLWSSKTEVPMSGNETVASVAHGGTQGEYTQMAKVTDIDTYFKDKHVDMIKMDIEGAEMEAVKGGINVIKRDRPVLAISIYHRIKDYYEIAEYLMSELSDYTYFVRQQSMMCSETVLFAVPR